MEHVAFKESKHLRCEHVEGRISDLLHGISNFSDYALDLIKKPINDSDGRPIGQIDFVDVATDKWYGRIITDTSLIDSVCESIEIKKENLKDEKTSN